MIHTLARSVHFSKCLVVALFIAWGVAPGQMLAQDYASPEDALQDIESQVSGVGFTPTVETGLYTFDLAAPDTDPRWADLMEHPAVSAVWTDGGQHYLLLEPTSYTPPSGGDGAPPDATFVNNGGNVNLGPTEPMPAPTELAGLRTANSRTYRLADGSYRKLVSGGFLNFRNPQGEWQALDANLTDIGNNWVQTTATDRHIALNTTTGHSTMQLLRNGGQLTMGQSVQRYERDANGNLVGTPEPMAPNFTATVQEKGLVLDEVWAGVDRVQQLDYWFLETDYVLQNAPSPTTQNGYLVFSEVVTVPQGATLTTGQGNPGDLGWAGELVVMLGSEQIARFHQPFFFDSHSNPRTAPESRMHGEYRLSPTNNSNEYQVEVLVPLAWLNDPARVYPVTIDPTVSNTYSTGDISSDYLAPSPACSGNLTVTLPTGVTITGTDSDFDYTAQGGAWLSEQRADLNGPTGTYAFPAMGGNLGGTQNHSATGLTIANGATGGALNFELQPWRTWGNATPGCNTVYQVVPNNTWNVSVTYTGGGGGTGGCTTDTYDMESEAVSPTNIFANITLANTTWSNVPNGVDDDRDWKIADGNGVAPGGTPSYLTGPFFDHTLGTAAGQFMYMETSSTTGQTAILESAAQDFSTATSVELSFWYHMYGATMGDLHVEWSTDGGVTWSTNYTLSGQQQTDYADPWNQVTIDLTGVAAGNPNFMIRFRGEAGTSYTSDFCLDDIELTRCDGPCSVAAPTVSPLTESVCGSGSGTFTASGSTGNYEWFDAATGGTSLGTGATFNSPTVSTTTSYWVEAQGSGGSAGTVRITEVDLGGTDRIEIQNVGNAPVDVTGWTVAISDSYADIQQVNFDEWNLSGTMNTGDLDWRGDVAGGNDWGANMFWNPGSNGWALLIDNNGNVVDFVAWEWSGADIGTMNITVNGFPITGADIQAVWAGNGTASGGWGTPNSGQLAGTTENNDATDWVTGALNIPGTNPGLTIPWGTSGGGSCSSSRVEVTVDVGTIPADPTVTPLAVESCIPTDATFTASGSTGSYEWYDAPTGGTLVSTNASYTTPVVGATTSWWVQAMDLVSNPVFTTLATDNNQDGIMFDINALNTVTIDEFETHFDPDTYDEIRIYYKVGTHVGFENTAGAWTLVGTEPNFTSSGIGTADLIPIPVNIIIPAGQTYAFYITTDGAQCCTKYTNGTGVGNVHTADGNIEILEGTGKDALFGTNYQPRIFNGTVHYSVGGGGTSCASNRIQVTLDIVNNSTWTAGAGTDDWENPNNWTAGEPSCNCGAYVPAGPPFNPVIDQPVEETSDLIIDPGASVTMAPGTQLDVCGDFLNSGTFIDNTSEVRFIGTTGQQTVQNFNAFYNVEVNNPNGLLLTTDMTIDNQLDLSLGVVQGNGNLTDIRTANPFAVVNSSAASYVWGQMRRDITMGAQAYHFAVGDDPAGHGYMAVEFDFNEDPDYTELTTEYWPTPIGSAPPNVVECGNLGYNTWAVPGFWRVDPSPTTAWLIGVGLSLGEYTVSAWPSLASVGAYGNAPYNYTPITGNISASIAKSNDNGATWAMDGNCVPASDLTGGGVVMRANITTGFSDFGVAVDDVNPFPVELLDFYGRLVNGNDAELVWQTANEQNNKGFYVERRKKGTQTFTDVGFRQGAGTTQEPRQYLLQDENLQPGTYLYRLRQVDFDNRISYSNEVELRVGSTAELQAEVYPNPTNGPAELRLNLPQTTELHLRILSLEGRKVWESRRSLNAGTHTLQLNLAELPAGVYQVVCTANGQQFIEKIVRK